MAAFNYMDEVPVKIAEKYKPPPKAPQLPQSINNLLQLPAQHYHESPQYQHDFELEKKVLSKIPEWRRMRQNARDQRLQRKQKREEELQRILEQRHKQMLGAVEYPDAEELCSDSDEPSSEGKSTQRIDEAAAAVKCEMGNFYDILQPTILPQSAMHHHTRNKSNSSFNYKDFEEDTSSPFDNIELKTINDLDILAQVLQNTQLRPEHSKAADTTKDAAATAASLNEQNADLETKMSEEPNVNSESQNAAAYESQNAATEEVSTHPQLNSNYSPLYNTTFLANHNYITFPTPHNNCSYNSSSSPVQASAFLSHNCLNANSLPNHNLQTVVPPLCPTDWKAKADSVPDILKELAEEVQSAQNRRVRNSSCSAECKEYNNTNTFQTKADAANAVGPLKYSHMAALPSSFNKLKPSTQKLAEYISSMGFPLERVANTVQIFGDDDKKIFEHLISLGELVDLGFEESKTSEALIKFDNNKEKALEFLIS